MWTFVHKQHDLKEPVRPGQSESWRTFTPLSAPDESLLLSPSNRWYHSDMALDITQIQLTDSERLMLAEASERAGKPWEEVLYEALRQYGNGIPRERDGSERNGDEEDTVYAAMKRLNLLGCLTECPADLSTNPDYMEGFGEDDR